MNDLESRMEQEARLFVSCARQQAATGCYSKAFDLFNHLFERFPSTKSLYEPEYRAVLTKLNDLLVSMAKKQDVFLNFNKALQTYPENTQLLNEIGKNLYKFGYYEEAWGHFQKALKLDTGYADAEKNINAVKNFLVERWHFRMLNDRIRNDAYRRAIKDTLVPHLDSVLDIGTGTGLLSLYAYKCKPIVTTGIEASETMAKLAESITADNDASDIIIINKMSTNISSHEIGTRSLVLVELFDSGLFGEHVLQVLNHAWDNLISRGGRVLPQRAEFFIIGANCDQLNHKYQMPPSVKQMLNILQNVNFHLQTKGETYDCDDVASYKDLKYLTEPASVLKIDFNNKQDIVNKYFGREKYHVELNVTKSGCMNVLIGWFDLYLTDKIKLTTDPRSPVRATAWQQPIFFDYLYEEVKANDIIPLQLAVVCEKIQVLLSDKTKGSIHRISADCLKFLNDQFYMEKIIQCIGSACVYLGQLTEIADVDIVDFSPFPLYGLMMLRKGINKLYCYARTEDDENFFRFMLIQQGILLHKVCILVGDSWTIENFKNQKFHSVFSYTFESCGDVNIKQRDLIEQVKMQYTHQGALLLPHNISLMGHIVSSDWLDINHRIFDKNVHNFKIEMHLNKYQVSQVVNLDLTNLEYTSLTEDCMLASNISNMKSTVFNLPIVCDGDANAVLCWYNVELMENMEEISTYRKSAFVDGMAFLANPRIPMSYQGAANILRCVDLDGQYKLIIDVETP